MERPHLPAVGVPGQLQVHPARGGLGHHNRLVCEQDRRPRGVDPGQGAVEVRRVAAPSPAMSLTPTRSNAAPPRRMAVFSLRSGCTPSRSSSLSHEAVSSTKYSWLPVTKNDPSRDQVPQRFRRRAEFLDGAVHQIAHDRHQVGLGRIDGLDDARGMRPARQRPEMDIGHHGDAEPAKGRVQPTQAHRNLQQVGRTRAR